jgi:hypothetical protein
LDENRHPVVNDRKTGRLRSRPANQYRYTDTDKDAARRNLSGSARRWIALAYLYLVLIFVGLETTHAHPSGDLARGSRPCAICIAVHVNAPALTAHSLPVLFTVERLTVLFRAEHKGATQDLTLFIRPPPIA